MVKHRLEGTTEALYSVYRDAAASAAVILCEDRFRIRDSMRMLNSFDCA